MCMKDKNRLLKELLSETCTKSDYYWQHYYIIYMATLMCLNCILHFHRNISIPVHTLSLINKGSSVIKIMKNLSFLNWRPCTYIIKYLHSGTVIYYWNGLSENFTSISMIEKKIVPSLLQWSKQVHVILS